MPAVLAGLFWNYALPYLLDKFVSAGVVAAEKATGIKTVEDLVSHIAELKTYHTDADFPHGKNGV